MRRLLPCDPHIAWTPYVWLAYLGLFLLVPAMRHAGPLEWTLDLIAVAVFLVLYFTGYWVSGGRLVLIAAAIFAIGAAFAPSNANASVFCVYAAAFAGRFAPARRALQAIGVLVALEAIESLALHLPADFWVSAMAFTMLIGGLCMHQAELRRAAQRLAESQAEVQQLVRIAERERIARDLHDLLGHTLSLIALKAELAGKLLAISPERAAAEIRDVETVTRDALREVRAAIGGYRSEGLPAELARARLVLEAAGVRPEYFIMPLALPAAAEAALALAVQEAVTNVVRHAGAAVCSITLERREGAVRLEIADDGRGGAAAAVAGAAGAGMGLRAMRERLAGLGGQFEISAVGEAGGTRLVITLPYRDPAAGVGVKAAAAEAAVRLAEAGAVAPRLAPERAR